MKSTYVDMHCHLFTLGDITLSERLNTLSLGHPITNMLAAPFIGLAANKIKDKLLGDFGTLLKVMESDNTKHLNELKKAIESDSFTQRYQRAVICPLIMDFDYKETRKSLSKQYQNLMQLVEEKKNQQLPISIRPFIGVDPRRFISHNSFNKPLWDKFWKEYLISPDSDAKDLYNNDGALLGIKLYPPLGWDVWQENNLGLHDFYQALFALGVPIIAHAGTGMYNTVEDAYEYTDPRQWEQVFTYLDGINGYQVKSPICFAHFGGEKQVLDLYNELCIPKPYTGGNPNHFNFNRNWTHSIAKLVKTRSYCFADISAIKFKGQFSYKKFANLCTKLESRGLGNQPLSKKLIWGTDYPMSLPDYGSYLSQFKNYLDLEREANIIADIPNNYHSFLAYCKSTQSTAPSIS